MNVNHRGEELCSACGCATGHAGYGEGSIGYVDGTIGPLCNECNAQLCIEIEADSAEIKRLRDIAETWAEWANQPRLVAESAGGHDV